MLVSARKLAHLPLSPFLSLSLSHKQGKKCTLIITYACMYVTDYIIKSDVLAKPIIFKLYMLLLTFLLVNGSTEFVCPIIGVSNFCLPFVLVLNICF